MTDEHEPMPDRLAPSPGAGETRHQQGDVAPVPAAPDASSTSSVPNPVDPSDDAQPKGAIAVTAFLAVVILASWLGVLALFMARR